MELPSLSDYSNISDWSQPNLPSARKCRSSPGSPIRVERGRLHPTCGSEHAHGEPGRERGSELLTSAQIVASDYLGREDRFRRLGVGADDDRLSDRPQPPSSRNPRNLTRG